jgi:hypothetical protein
MLHREDLEATAKVHSNPQQEGALRCFASCHPKSGVEVLFKPGSDYVRVACHKCGAFICDLAVKGREGSESGFAA